MTSTIKSSSEEEKRLEEQIKPILEKLVHKVIKSKPDNVPEFMINYLREIGHYTESGLTIDEKKELESLRERVKKYRELDSICKDNQ